MIATRVSSTMPRFRISAPLVPLASLSLLLAACGDDGPPDQDPDAAAPVDASPAPDAPIAPDAGPPDCSGECDPPVVEVHFPPPRSQADLEAITVRGTAVDDTGIAAIRVNGVLATTSDDFATWQAVVPLQQGANAIVVQSEDDEGYVAPSAARVDVVRRKVVRYATHLTVDPASGSALIADPGQAEILHLDLATDVITSLPGGALGEIPEGSDGIPFALDPAASRAYGIADREDDLPDALFVQNLTTGQRTVISDDGIGTGEDLIEVETMVLDAAHDRIVLFDDAHRAIMAVDLDSGDRVVLADQFTGTGPVPAFIARLALTADGNRAYFINSAQRALLSVDLATGNRTVVSNDTTGTGPAFTNPGLVALDEARNRVLINDIFSLVAVDLTTGDRTVLPGTDTSAGPGQYLPSSLMVDEPRDRLLIADGSYITAVDLATGERTRLQDAVGTGPLDDHLVVVLDDAGGRALLLDTTLAVTELDIWNPPTAGQRTILSSGTVGASEPVGDMVLDLARNRVLVFEIGEAMLWAVDLATGERTLVSGADAGAGPALFEPRSMVMDTDGDRVLVSQADAVLAVDPTTGDRTIVASEDVGTGPSFSFATDMAIASGQQEVLLAHGGRVLALSLADGNRRIVSGDGVGTGPSFGYLDGAALDLARGRALFTENGDEESTAHVFAMDLDDGTRSYLAGDGAGSGTRIFNARGIAVDERRGIAVVTSTSPSEVFALDLVTLERVLLAR
jgi:hypothetical protein